MMNKATQKKTGRRPSRATGEVTESLPWRAILHGGLAAAAVAAITLTVLSLIAYFTPDPGALARPLGLLCASLSATSGGYFAMRRAKRAPLLCGLGVGILMVTVMLALSFGFAEDGVGYTAAISAMLHAGIFVCTIGGALLGARKPRQKRHKKRQNRK